MAVGVVRFEESSIRKEGQDLKRYHSAEKSVRAERGSYCCWLSQRGSNWIYKLSL